MKRFIVAFISIVLAVGSVSAARTARSSRAHDGGVKPVTIGVKAGINASQMVGHGTYPCHGLAANYQFGLTADFRITRAFAIAPELVFSAQGMQNYCTRIQANYINIPVIFKFYPISKLSIDVAPQIGFNVYGKWADMGVYNNKFNTAVFSVGLGLTYNFNRNFFAQFRYTIDATCAMHTSLGDSRNSVFQLSAGYHF